MLGAGFMVWWRCSLEAALLAQSHFAKHGMFFFDCGRIGEESIRKAVGINEQSRYNGHLAETGISFTVCDEWFSHFLKTPLISTPHEAV